MARFYKPPPGCPPCGRLREKQLPTIGITLWTVALTSLLLVSTGCVIFGIPVTPSTPLPASPTLTTPPPPATPSPTPAAMLPEGVLAVFHEQGGIAGISNTLTVFQAGTLRLEARNAGPSQTATAPPDMFALLQNLLAAPTLPTIEPEPAQLPTCADCMVHIITARTNAGIQQWRVADPSAPPPALTELLIVLQDLRASITSIITPAPPTPVSSTSAIIYTNLSTPEQRGERWPIAPASSEQRLLLQPPPNQAITALAAPPNGQSLAYIATTAIIGAGATLDRPVRHLVPADGTEQTLATLPATSPIWLATLPGGN